MTTLTTAIILSDGQTVDQSYQLLSLDVLKEVNRIPRATLVFADGDIPRQQFPITDSGVFAPGKSLEIRLRQGNEAEVSLFKGLVTRFGLDVLAHKLSVDAKHPAVKLTRGRRSQVF